MRLWNFVFVLSGLMLLSSQALGQFEPTPVNRTTTRATIDGQEYFQHTVLAGQTLFGISQAYGVSIETILNANQHLPDLRNGLRAGLVLHIPVNSVAPLLQAPQRPTQIAQNITQTSTVRRPERSVQIQTIEILYRDFIEHTVDRRETLFGISRRYQVSQDSILMHNPIARQGLHYRQVLKIPVKKYSAVPFFYYDVQQGETLENLSTHFGVTQMEVMNLNQGADLENLAAGSLLRIPARAAAKDWPPYIVVDQQAAESKRLMVYCANPRLKEHYNVAVLIPLYLDQFNPEVTRINASHVSFSFLSFYQGILIALDSIAQAGVSITLHTFDIGRNASDAQRLVNNNSLEQMDLIIGPFFPEPLRVITAFANRRGIAVVSPFYDNPDLLVGNANLFQVSPSLQTMLESTAEYVARNYTHQNIIFVHNNQPEAQGLINAFRNRLTSDLAMVKNGRYLNTINGHLLSELGLVGKGRRRNGEMGELRNGNVNRQFHEVVYRTGGMAEIQRHLDATRQNIIITLIGGEAFVSNYLRQLDLMRNRFQITVIGTPQWLEYQTVNLRLYESLNVHNMTYDFVDYRHTHEQNFVTRFRKAYRTEPDFDAFHGVRTGYFFFDALGRYGREFFKCVEQLNSPEFTNPFHFKNANSEGWENIKFVLFRQAGFRQQNVATQ